MTLNWLIISTSEDFEFISTFTIHSSPKNKAPFVSGRLTNPDNMPLWQLPNEKVLSGIKSKEYQGSQSNQGAVGISFSSS